MVYGIALVVLVLHGLCDVSRFVFVSKMEQHMKIVMEYQIEGDSFYGCVSDITTCLEYESVEKFLADFKAKCIEQWSGNHGKSCTFEMCGHKFNVYSFMPLTNYGKGTLDDIVVLELNEWFDKRKKNVI